MYETMNDCSTREFIFVVKPFEIPEGHVEVVNAFTVLRAAQCHTGGIMIPPPRNTLDNTCDDILHNDILLWLERKGVGWARSEVNTKGKEFVDSITAALFPLSSKMFEAMSDSHNAGINPPFLSVFIFIVLYKRY